MKMFWNKKNGNNLSEKQLQELQERIEAIRTRIQQKREQAKAAFEKLLQAIEKSKGIPGLEHLAEQLGELGQIFMEGKKTLEEHPDKEVVAFEKTESELALEDILEAMESMALSQDKKTMLSAKLLKERLKQIMFAKFAQQNNHPSDWTKSVSSGDMLEMLQSAEISTTINRFESPMHFLQQSIMLAEESVGLKKQDTILKNQEFDARGAGAKKQDEPGKGTP